MPMLGVDGRLLATVDALESRGPTDEALLFPDPLLPPDAVRVEMLQAYQLVHLVALELDLCLELHPATSESVLY